MSAERLTESALDWLKIAMTAGGLFMLWNISGTLSAIQTDMASLHRSVDQHNSRLLYLERKDDE